MATQLSGEQKAAILLKAIGEDAAALVMKSLDPKEIRPTGGFHECDGKYHQGRGIDRHR